MELEIRLILPSKEELKRKKQEEVVDLDWDWFELDKEEEPFFTFEEEAQYIPGTLSDEDLEELAELLNLEEDKESGPGWKKKGNNSHEK